MSITGLFKLFHRKFLPLRNGIYVTLPYMNTRLIPEYVDVFPKTKLFI